jgi:Ca2+-binding RTX toxin-like protein
MMTQLHGTKIQDCKDHMLIETLEERRMMSAAAISVAHGVLTVRGSNADDQINVRSKGGEVNVSVVGGGHQNTKSFAPARIRQINIRGLAGNDRVSVSMPAFKGKTTVTGDGGNDHINVITNGPATLLGGEGDDKLTTDLNKKSVSIDGGDGNDVIRGSDGQDILTGGPGNDFLAGESGDDNIRGGDGMDTLSGGDGDDLLFGEAGVDRLSGDGGNDTLDGGSGSNLLFGGDGDDIFFADNGENDHVAGDGGSDSATVDTIDVTASGDVVPTAAELQSFQNLSKIEAVRIAFI